MIDGESRPGRPSPDSTARGAITSSRRIAGIRVFALFVTLAGSLALARALGPDGRGAHGFFTAAVMILSLLLSGSTSIGGYVAVLHRDADARHIARNIPWIAAVIGVIAAGLVWIVLVAPIPILPAGLVAIDELVPLSFLAIASFVASTGYLQLALAEGRPLAAAVLSFGPFAVASIGYVGSWLFGGSLQIALWCFALAPTALLVTAALVRRPLVTLVLGAPDARLIRETVRQGLRNYLGDLSATLLQRSDVVLLGILSSVTSVGLYVVAYQTAEPLLVIASASTVSILAVRPHSVEAGSGDLVSRLVRDTVAIVVGLALLAGVVAPIAIPALFGPAFAPSVGPFLVLLPGVVMLSAGRLALAELARWNLLERSTSILLLGFAVNLGVNLALIPSLGMWGAAIASTGAYALVAVLALRAVAQRHAIPARRFVPTTADLIAIYTDAVGWLRRRPSASAPASHVGDQ